MAFPPLEECRANERVVKRAASHHRRALAFAGGNRYPNTTSRSLASIWSPALDQHFGDRAVALGVQRRFHLHRLDGEQHVAGLDRLPGGDRERRDDARHRRADMRLVAGLGLAARLARADAPCARSGTLTRRGWPLSSKNTRDHALVVGLADRQAADDQRLALLDVDEDLVLGLHAVEIDRRRQHADRAVDLLRGGEVRKHLRIHQPGGELVFARACGRASPRSPCGSASRSAGLSSEPGRDGDRLLALQRLLLQRLRPAARRLAEIAAQHRDDRIREGDVLGRVLDIGDGQVLAAPSSAPCRRPPWTTASP